MNQHLNIIDVEKQLLEFKQAECPVTHRFGPNLYIREVFLPADTWVIGHHHNYADMNIMLKGKLRIYNNDGTTSILEAPITKVFPPGRKAVYVIEDTIWQNVYSTSEQDIEILEDTYLTKSPVSLQYHKDRFLRLTNKQNQDKNDYQLFLDEFNLTEDIVRSISEDTNDLINLPDGEYKFQTGQSTIEGRGIFATATINKGDIIGLSRIFDRRTVLGRYTNHSANPNAKMVIDNETNNIWLIAIQDINGQEGSEVGDEITINYRAAYQLNQNSKKLLDKGVK